MIDPLVEDIISPGEATRMFARSTCGKYPHVSFVYRAMKSGCRGVLLESIKTPKLATSRQAVARFFAQLSDAGPTPVDPVRRNADRERASRDVERELDHIGI